jgi:hypothetical protein
MVNIAVSAKPPKCSCSLSFGCAFIVPPKKNEQKAVPKYLIRPAATFSKEEGIGLAGYAFPIDG